MSRGPDAATLLERRLVASAAAAGCAIAVVSTDWTPWASATFNGACHELRIALPARAAAEAWLADLPEADLPLAGHLVADIAVVSADRSNAGIDARIEALSVAVA